MSSWTLPLVVAAVGVVLLIALGLRLFVMVRRFKAVSAAVSSHIGNESGTLRTRVTDVQGAIAELRTTKANTVVTASEGPTAPLR